MGTKVFVLILNYRNYQETSNCVANLLRSDLPTGTEIVVLDNTHDTKSQEDLVRNFPKVKLITNFQNKGFAGGNNPGIRHALNSRASHILLINPDAIVHSQFLKRLINSLNKHADAGLIAPALEHKEKNQTMFGLEGYMDWKKAQARHVNLEKILKSHKLRKAEFVSFACALIKAEVFQKIGFLDEGYFMYLEDVDFCLRAREAGFDIFLDPSVIVYHQTSSSFRRPTDKLKISFRSQMRFISKWLKFPNNVLPYLYTLFFYPYLYVLWTYHSYKYRSSL